jgi:hypothetical protein
MKGIVFTEFLEMVESRFSPEMSDAIITAANPPSGGAYTAVGTYDFRELVSLVAELSKRTSTPVPDLLKAFGVHLFGQFVAGFPEFFEGDFTALSFLKSVEGVIHVEVRKLYPDAELPTFECASRGPSHLSMTYRSTRPLGDFAEGLILGCIRHYGEDIALARENLACGEETCVRFELTRRDAA